MINPTIIENFKLSKYKYLASTSWASPKILWGTIVVSIVNENYPDNNYPILCSNGEKFSINGKHSGGGQSLVIYHYKNNPIKDGRLVDNYTFALRLKNFLKDVQVNDACMADELEDLQRIANDLLDWQISTVTDQEEIDYLRRLKLI